MLTPEYLLRISEGSEQIAEYLHSDIINRIIERMMIRINRGDSYMLTAQDKWQLEVLQEAGYLLEDLQREIAKRTKQQTKEIAEAFEEAGILSMEYDDKIYKAAGLSPIPLMESPYMTRLMQRTYDATIGEWKNFTRSFASEGQQLFIKAMDKAYTDVVSGSMSYVQVVKEALETVISQGAIITYPSGRTDTIETATLRAVRTGISQMSSDITDARMEEMNWDIILVSSHLGARVTGKEDYTDHSWWQGKFYSKSGMDKRFPPYSVCGPGTVQGIHGANCRHTHGPGDGEHNPFEQYDSEENKKAYEIQQRQRALERRIRNTKREVQNMQTAVSKCENEKLKFELQQSLDKKSYLLEKQNSAYKEYCELHNLKELKDRLHIAKWNREQAAKARGAARRYKNAKGIK